MATIEWPAGVRQTYERTSLNYVQQENSVRTDMSAGPTKVRKTFTAVSNYLTFEIYLPLPEVQLFMAFFNVTLNAGVNTFNFPDPILGITKDARIMEVPKISYLDGIYFVVSIRIEVLP
jgi:hypothetical protein